MYHNMELETEWEEEMRRNGFAARPTRPTRPPRPVQSARPTRRPGVARGAVQQPSQPEGSEYNRWVQDTLNRVVGLRLPVNGIIGPETRSAVRDFQRKQSLTVSGIVGPDTEEALKKAEAAGAAVPASDAQEFEWFGTELEEEVNRGSREYIQWVQTSLNRIVGLRLVVDGISGPKTRSAVRSFQQQRGLTVDGIVGPQTEGALIAAGAGTPPGGSTPPYVPPPVVPTPSPGGQTLRSNAATIALQEYQRWGQGSTQEGDPAIRPVLEDYWRTGVGYLPTQSSWWSAVPWSAAFISWVMRKAGAGSAFRYSARHTDYVGEAKRNRLANNSTPFKTYRTTEVAPRVGDIVCKERNNSGVTYDNVDQGPRDSHCDIVVEVLPGQIRTVGGNLSQSVGRSTVTTDANGHVTTPGYYAIVRVGS